MKTWGEGRYSSIILDLSTKWRWVVNFTPSSFTPGQWDPGTRRIRCWVGPRSGLDASRKMSYICQESNLGCPTPSPSLYRLSYPGFPLCNRPILNFSNCSWIVLSIFVFFPQNRRPRFETGAGIAKNMRRLLLCLLLRHYVFQLQPEIP
jgi:hypothetical protein